MVNFQGVVAAATASNMTLDTTLPPLPSYTEMPIGDMLPYISDFWFSFVFPVVLYWIASGFFHVIDVYDLWPQYRLHTPEEITRRNHVTRYECFRDVLIQQVLQMSVGALLSITDPPQLTGREDYDVAVWATRVRLAQRAVPHILGAVGLNAAAISKSVASSHPLIAGALAGGYYPFLTTELLGSGGVVVPAFAMWEVLLAKAIYWLAIPGLQLFVAISILDTWQYFLHRLMHTNKWLYTHIHSRHHRLYVPYGYGALYNHPLEGFILDTIGSGMAYKLTRMTLRQGTFFYSLSTVKTVDDHCGYALPWDPLQLLTGNNAAYHDIHHQTWGIKTNFSQPYLTIWDKLLNTMYTGDRAEREKRKREAEFAGKQRAAKEAAKGTATKTNGTATKVNGATR